MLLILTQKNNMLKKYIVIIPYYMPDGRRYENWEIVTFMNDSLKDYFLYEWYILQQSNITDTKTACENPPVYKQNLEKQAIWEMYKHYFELYQESLQKNCILAKDIINSISIWEFIQQKYFNSNKSLWLK